MGNFQDLPIENDFWRRRYLTQMLAPEAQVPTQEAPVPSQEPSTLERYKQVFEEQPDISQYKPSLLRRIASGIIAGGGTPEEGEAARYRPFMRQYGAWKQRLGGLGELAGLESSQEKATAETAYKRAQMAAEQQRGEAAGALGRYRDYLTGEKAYERQKEFTQIQHQPVPKYLEGAEGFAEIFPGGEPRALNVKVKPPPFATSREGVEYIQKQMNARNAANNTARRMIAELKNKASLKGLNGTQQSAIYNLATQKAMVENPDFGDLFEYNETSKRNELIEDYDPILYQRYLAEIKANVLTGINEAVPGELDEEENEEDIYDIEKVE